MKKDTVSGKTKQGRRQYSDDFKEGAVQMILDGHTPKSVAANLGISCENLLYRWKSKILGKNGQTASALEARVRELEAT